MMKFAQVILVLCFILLIFSPADAQKQKSVIQSKKSSTTKASVKTGVVEMQAGLVYTSGDVKAVARTQFMFLDESLEKILKDTGLQPENAGLGILSDYAFSRRYPSQYVDFLQKAEPAIKTHIKQTITSDFNGNAKSEPLPIGTYYLMGVTETMKGAAIWNLQIEVKIGTNKIILDQNNAALAY